MLLADKLNSLHDFAKQTMNDTILDFWRNEAIDEKNGGFYGEISNDLKKNTNAAKGLILNARILWTFSAAYKLTQNERDKELALRAFDYLITNFYDEDFGGYFWTVNPEGKPHESKKQVYALAFTMYGLSEYYKISKDVKALERAISLFYLIEEKAFDKEFNGYFEAYNRDWSEINDMRLSTKDMNEKKTMNTHLHIVEAYANLFSIWKDQELEQKLKNLVNIFLNQIISTKDNHLNLFFDEKWNVKSSTISYGHDIEAGWLVHEAALILQNRELIEEVESRVPLITDAALKGIHKTGALLHEGDRKGKHLDHEFEWWPQAEALVALLNTYEITHKEQYLDIALQIASFITNYFIDNENGEWFYRVDLNGNPITTYPKAGLWKCPYHNGRACIEIINRINKLL